MADLFENPLGLDGFEFVEFCAPEKGALEPVFAAMGFTEIARHRSKDVQLWRQGDINLIANYEPRSPAWYFAQEHGPSACGMGWRVRDAARAYAEAIARGAEPVESRTGVMELRLPAFRGIGGSMIYLIDRYGADLSIYDIDFKPIPGVDQQPAALAGMDYFGLVQYVDPGRSEDWIRYYETMFDFSAVPEDERYGILPKGKVLKSPCGQFMWQLIEPDPWMESDRAPENLERIGLGTPDVGQAVTLLKGRGVEFIETSSLHPEDRGALTRRELGSVSFELVHRTRA